MAGSAACAPVSYPRLPPTHAHPMWQAWDMAAEMCLLQLPQLLADPAAEFQPSSFFSEQLTAFELWLSLGSRDKKPPEQLPIVLQVGLWCPGCGCGRGCGCGCGWESRGEISMGMLAWAWACWRVLARAGWLAG
jgi:hypothetical protein